MFWNNAGCLVISWIAAKCNIKKREQNVKES